MKSARLDLRIEELILEGVAPEDSARLSAALQRELSRLIQERGLPAELRGETPALSSSVVLRSGASAESTGTEVARALYSSMIGAAAPRKGPAHE